MLATHGALTRAPLSCCCRCVELRCKGSALHLQGTSSFSAPEILPNAPEVAFSRFLAAPQHVAFPGQGSDQSRSYNLSLSYGSARSSTHCAWLGVEPASQSSPDSTDPVAPQPELPGCLLLCRLCPLMRRRFSGLVRSSLSIFPSAAWAFAVAAMKSLSHPASGSVSASSPQSPGWWELGEGRAALGAGPRAPSPCAPEAGRGPGWVRVPPLACQGPVPWGM